MSISAPQIKITLSPPNLLRPFSRPRGQRIIVLELLYRLSDDRDQGPHGHVQAEAVIITVLERKEEKAQTTPEPPYRLAAWRE